MTMTLQPGTCPLTGKKQLSRTLARDTAKRQRRSYDARVQHYRCKCGWWHTGNNPENKGRRRMGRLR